MVVALQWDRRAVFLFAFAKNARDNIAEDELRTLKEVGAAWLNADRQALIDAIRDGALQEVERGNQDATGPADGGAAGNGG